MNSKLRFESLDGWRGISILCVLAGHLFPLGPHMLKLNEAVAASGMALFFILSGFLITNTLIHNRNITHFFIRRAARILPLAILVILITFAITGASGHEWSSHLLFYANWPPMGLTAATSHFWSLCLEAQFYVFIGLLVWILKGKSFYILPVLCIAITLNRIYFDVQIAINTYFRADEILAGCILALTFNYASEKAKSFIARIDPALLFVLLILSANPHFETLNYARPYIALLAVGSTLFNTQNRWYSSAIRHSFLIFMATTSYAVYIIHGGLRETWLGQGDTLEKYAKRPLFLLVTFGLAYISTKYYEAYWIKIGKQMTRSKASDIKKR